MAAAPEGTRGMEVTAAGPEGTTTGVVGAGTAEELEGRKQKALLVLKTMEGGEESARRWLTTCGTGSRSGSPRGGSR